jgi:hypothetical protein
MIFKKYNNKRQTLVIKNKKALSFQSLFFNAFYVTFITLFRNLNYKNINKNNVILSI